MTKPRTSDPAAPRFTPARGRACPRHDGWTPERQVAFIDALAASGCVAEACGAVGLSRSAAYALRVRPEAQQFRMAWDAALDLAVRRLADACFSRALNGVAVPHLYRGEQVGEHRRYDERLAMFLLRYRDPLRYAASLDRMVFSGHYEGAGVRFAHARNAVADGEALDPGQPYAIEPIAEVARRPPEDDAPAAHVPGYVAEQRHAREQARLEAAGESARQRLEARIALMEERMAEGGEGRGGG